MTKGTTPSWMRPIRKVVEIDTGEHRINVAAVLAETGMASSKAEGKRMIEQGIIWMDKRWEESLVGTCIWDRIYKTQLEQGKFLTVQANDVICIGRTIDDAICHRIVFR